MQHQNLFPNAKTDWLLIKDTCFVSGYFLILYLKNVLHKIASLLNVLFRNVNTDLQQPKVYPFVCTKMAHCTMKFNESKRMYHIKIKSLINMTSKLIPKCQN